MMRSEQEIKQRLAELSATYAQTERIITRGRKPTHAIALGRMIRDKIDLLQWVLGESDKL
jgi:hypothetical protein